MSKILALVLALCAGLAHAQEVSFSNPPRGFSFPLAINGAGAANTAFTMTGSFSPASGTSQVFYQDTTLNAVANTSALATRIGPTLVEAASGTHALLGALFVSPTFTDGTATTTNAFGGYFGGYTAPAGTVTASTVLIAAAPTGATTNYALNVTGQSIVAGHLLAGGTAPSMGACGTSPSVAGADEAMLITVGTGGSATTCAVTFGTNFATAPICVAQNNTDRVAYSMVTTTSTLTITATAAFTASSKFHVLCRGY
jgi:hypothetical protein